MQGVVIINIYGVPYNEVQIEFNITQKNRIEKDIDGLAIHGTANTAKTANKYMHYKYFNSGNKNSSADFFVDHEGILRINNWRQYYTWHCGDFKARGLSKPKHNLYNKNTVSVEICVNNADDSEKMAKTIENTQKLVLWLCKNELNLELKDVWRHFDISKKYCPYNGYDMIEPNNPNLSSKWVSFKGGIEENWNDNPWNLKDLKNKYLEWTEILDKVSSNSKLWIKQIKKIKAIAEEDGDLGLLENFKYFDIYIYKLGNGLKIDNEKLWEKSLKAIQNIANLNNSELFNIFKYTDELIQKIQKIKR